MERERDIIKKMPDKETLEEFLNHGGELGRVKVVFNRETGEFEWVEPREDATTKCTDTGAL